MAQPRIPQSRKKPVRMPAIWRNPVQAENDTKLIPHAHLQAIQMGYGDEGAFLTVAFRVVVGGSLTIFATDKEGEKRLEDEFDPAILALKTLGERIEKTGKVVATGDELAALRNALLLTDDLQDLTTRKQHLVIQQQVQNFIGGFAYTMKNIRRLNFSRTEPAAAIVVESVQ